MEHRFEFMIHAGEIFERIYHLRVPSGSDDFSRLVYGLRRLMQRDGQMMNGEVAFDTGEAVVGSLYVHPHGQKMRKRPDGTCSNGNGHGHAPSSPVPSTCPHCVRLDTSCVCHMAMRSCHDPWRASGPSCAERLHGALACLMGGRPRLNKSCWSRVFFL